MSNPTAPAPAPITWAQTRIQQRTSTPTRIRTLHLHQPSAPAPKHLRTHALPRPQLHAHLPLHAHALSKRSLSHGFPNVVSNSVFRNLFFSVVFQAMLSEVRFPPGRSVVSRSPLVIFRCGFLDGPFAGLAPTVAMQLASSRRSVVSCVFPARCGSQNGLIITHAVSRRGLVGVVFR